ncbi:DUF1752-domain-containing protein [Paraphaeosphaeria sporulosa]|uniref:DUF1752-domain-containing protein n=1 Tax=Paraphaeosphaeria sporulosa TaxID=1460663 RepID=A0A177BXT6_9PLEO|nr:DUF1752-domain-containing protein [Paraphaeosphaeria sporulosa]OAG00163.1 DUF1752-domain-containing protein [Paraphaeosphaeria sporulosa]
MHVRDAPAGVDYGVVLPTVGWCPSARLAAWWAVRARLAAFVVATALEAAQSSQQASAAAGARGDVSASQPGCGAHGQPRGDGQKAVASDGDRLLEGSHRARSGLQGAGPGGSMRRLWRQGGARSDGPPLLGLWAVQGMPTIYYRPERCSLRGSCLRLLRPDTIYTAAPLHRAAAPALRRAFPRPRTTHRTSTLAASLLYVRRRPVAARRLIVEPAADRPDAITSPSTKADAPAPDQHSTSYCTCTPPTATAPHANMPLHAARPIVRVEHGSMHTIETRNAENLFGLWSVFKQCSPAMEDGKRYENMAWRVWSRETFCCQPVHSAPSTWSFDSKSAVTDDVPELSSSIASDDSAADSAITATTRSNSSSRPDLRRHDSINSQARGKHIAPIDLEKVVNSIQEKKAIEPLSPLPPQLAPPVAKETPKKPAQDTNTTPRPSSPPPTARLIPESSASTIATPVGSDPMSPMVGSEVSTSTDVSAHSVVHGFDPSRISTSVRSSTNLNPTPILKSSFISKPPPSRAEPVRKKAPMFTLGGSSDEDNSSSLEAYSLAKRSSLSDNLKKAGLVRKNLSFNNQVTTRTIHDPTSEESEGAIESESEEDSDDNAIEEEDSDEEWEDDNDDSAVASIDERPMFQRVDSQANLVSRRSLLTTMMHQGDRAQALQNAASRSTPAIRRSRTSTPNGPSTGNSPQEDAGLMMRQQATRSKPIIMTTSNVHPPALSPRTTRRNMLQTELTASLRSNLLWERQQKNATTNAVNKRAQSAVSMPAMRRAATTSDVKGLQAHAQQTNNLIKAATHREAAKNNSYNDYFDQGLQEYHQKGW